MIQQLEIISTFSELTAEQEERGRQTPTAQSFKTNETLCVSRVDRGPA